MLELSVYEGIPHLLTPVVTDMKEAANALRWCVAEMDRRYQLMSSLGVRNIGGYNRKVNEAIDAGEPLKCEIEHFIGCIDRGERPKSDTKNGLAVVEVLSACDRSLASGGVRIDLKLSSKDGAAPSNRPPSHTWPPTD